MKCENCGANNSSGALYCTQCGSDLVPEPTPNTGATENSQQKIPVQEEKSSNTRNDSNYETTTSYVPKQHPGKFNWGAMMLSFPWGIGNRCYLTLLTLIPIVGWIWAIFCGFKGNTWAWEKGNYRDMREFSNIQETWSRAGFISFIIVVIFIILYFLFFSTIISYFLLNSTNTNYY